MISFILSLACGVLVFLIDQLTKYAVASNFTLGEAREFINGLVNLVYIHNTGGAWGIFSGSTLLLTLISAVVMCICFFILFKYGRKSRLLHWAMSLVIFGGAGNMTDRIFRDGRVVDFLHFEFWDTFPVFNVADCAIVIGAGLLILYFILDTAVEYKQKRQTEEEENGQA